MKSINFGNTIKFKRVYEKPYKFLLLKDNVIDDSGKKFSAKTILHDFFFKNKDLESENINLDSYYYDETFKAQESNGSVYEYVLNVCGIDDDDIDTILDKIKSLTLDYDNTTLLILSKFKSEKSSIYGFKVVVMLYMDDINEILEADEKSDSESETANGAESKEEVSTVEVQQ